MLVFLRARLFQKLVRGCVTSVHITTSRLFCKSRQTEWLRFLSSVISISRHCNVIVNVIYIFGVIVSLLKFGNVSELFISCTCSLSRLPLNLVSCHNKLLYFVLPVFAFRQIIYWPLREVRIAA
jgi:hypothetical protein